MKGFASAPIAFSTLTLLCATAQAGAILQTTERELPGGKETEVTTLAVDNGKLRTETVKAGKTSAEDAMIFMNDTITAIDHTKKTYTVIDRAKLAEIGGKMNSAMKQMEEQLAAMPPEQRAMVEKMMGNQMPGGNKPKHVPIEYTRTARSERSGGYSCQIWEGKRDGVKVTEVCTTPFGSIAGGDELITVIKSMTAMMQEMTESMNSPFLRDTISSEWDSVRKIDGFPVVTRSFTNGKADSETAVTATRNAAVPASTFEVPAGYKRKDIDLGDK